MNVCGICTDRFQVWKSPGASYLDEYYWLDKEDPNSSNCRLIYNRGDRLPSDGQYGLGKCANEIVKLIMTPEKELQGETIEEFFSDDFFKTNFWTYWATMFAFEKWHSAAEMRRYAMRFIHHIDGLPDFTALKFNNITNMSPWLSHFWHI